MIVWFCFDFAFCVLFVFECFSIVLFVDFFDCLARFGRSPSPPPCKQDGQASQISEINPFLFGPLAALLVGALLLPSLPVWLCVSVASPGTTGPWGSSLPISR